MGVKYKEKTARILNDADTFSQVLEWQLFAEEQTARLFGYDGSVVPHRGLENWVAGENLHHRSGSRELTIEMNEVFPDFTWNYGIWGNYIRPMIEELDIYDSYELFEIQCRKCEVDWNSDVETVCWNCGEPGRVQTDQRPAKHNPFTPERRDVSESRSVSERNVPPAPDTCSPDLVNLRISPDHSHRDPIQVFRPLTTRLWNFDGDREEYVLDVEFSPITLMPHQARGLMPFVGDPLVGQWVYQWTVWSAGDLFVAGPSYITVRMSTFFSD